MVDIKDKEPESAGNTTVRPRSLVFIVYSLYKIRPDFFDIQYAARRQLYIRILVSPQNSAELVELVA